MHDVPKRIRKLLREHAMEAHEAELRRALLPLADDFDRWRRGELGSSELKERIHVFHDGPAREIFKAYNYGRPEAALAYAIHTGAVDRERVPPELLEHLGGWLGFYRDQDEHPDPPIEDEDDEPERRPLRLRRRRPKL